MHIEDTKAQKKAILYSCTGIQSPYGVALKRKPEQARANMACLDPTSQPLGPKRLSTASAIIGNLAPDAVSTGNNHHQNN
ncbi:unnamed protein product [Clonostachys rosea f. rosea IK726]|uniref:Uncharacterized protein n=2 Tax=Bionectria ochroleuca TaxID=29856 RepID=A0A0B7K6H0_BIOOC|nr:unnamed protein product [Clonostachys rosea f. rosea IK726]